MYVSIYRVSQTHTQVLQVYLDYGLSPEDVDRFE